MFCLICKDDQQGLTFGWGPYCPNSCLVRSQRQTMILSWLSFRRISEPDLATFPHIHVPAPHAPCIFLESGGILQRFRRHFCWFTYIADQFEMWIDNVGNSFHLILKKKTSSRKVFLLPRLMPPYWESLAIILTSIPGHYGSIWREIWCWWNYFDLQA